MIVFDIETTGIDPVENSILSIGAIDCESGIWWYDECICPAGKKVSQTALDINGFKEEDIYSGKKRPIELVERFVRWAKNFDEKPILAGHNVGSFDVQFLNQVAKEYNFKLPFSYRTVDLHSIAYAKFGKSLTHEQICIELGLPPEPKPHNALEGALSERNTFRRLMQ